MAKFQDIMLGLCTPLLESTTTTVVQLPILIKRSSDSNIQWCSRLNAKLAYNPYHRATRTRGKSLHSSWWQRKLNELYNSYNQRDNSGSSSIILLGLSTNIRIYDSDTTANSNQTTTVFQGYCEIGLFLSMNIW